MSQQRQPKVEARFALIMPGNPYDDFLYNHTDGFEFLKNLWSYSQLSSYFSRGDNTKFCSESTNYYCMYCFMSYMYFDYFQVLGAMFYAESLHRPQTSIQILNATEHEGCDKWGGGTPINGSVSLIRPGIGVLTTPHKNAI